MNKKTFVMALCMVGHSGYAVDQKTEVQYIDGSADQRQRLLDNALDHRNYPPIRVPEGYLFKVRDPVDPLKDVTKMSPELQIELHDALEEKTKNMKADVEKGRDKLESELEHAKQEVLSQLKNPEISENSPMNDIVKAAWKDVEDYKSKLRELEGENARFQELDSKGWVVVHEEELENLKKDVIRVVLKGKIAENASVEEVLKMAGHRVNDYDRTVGRLSGHVREKAEPGNSLSGWDQNRKLEAQLTNMQKGLRKLEELRPAALLATAMAGDPKKVDLLKAIIDAKNQGVQDIEGIVDGHYKGSILKPEVRSWVNMSAQELQENININRQEAIHNLVQTAMSGDPTGLDLVKAIRNGKNQGLKVQFIEQIVKEHYKGKWEDSAVSWVLPG